MHILKYLYLILPQTEYLCMGPHFKVLIWGHDSKLVRG